MARGVVTVGALVLPVRGVHRRIRALRREELERVDRALRAERARLWSDAGTREPRLANLMAWRRRVLEAPEWPFDVSTWLRFGLYVAVGAGSWVGAALVERLLGTVLE